MNITSKENYIYYNKFKVDVVGGYIAIDNFAMLRKYLEAVKGNNIPFIVLCSGFNGKDVIPICKKYPFIKEVIIFCGNVNKYKHYLTQYPGYVKNIFVDIRQVYNYIKYLGPMYDQGIKKFQKSDHFIFSYDDIQMDKQLEQCPVISAYEYDNCYFLVHRAYAHFFGDINDKREVIFTNKNFEKVKDYIKTVKNSKTTVQDKEDMIYTLKNLVDKHNFVELAIYKYSEESYFCYFLNRTMRQFDKGLISLAYYMGPFLFALNKYVKENPQNLAMNKNMTLYRVIKCTFFDFYLYYMNLNHIICFPSITSTSLDKDAFKTGNKALKINNKSGIDFHDLYNITMIFNYSHRQGDISPGIIVKDNKAKNGTFLSTHPFENEVILFPFTFARITQIIPISETKKKYEIYFDIINRYQYIEHILKYKVEKRTKFSDLD